MTSKDLLYALHTRSKKLIRELDDFANDIAACSFEEGWTVVSETIQLANTLAPTENKYKHTIKAVNRAWLAFAEQSDDAAQRLYATVISALEQIVWTDPAQGQRAYQLLYAFHAKHLHLLASTPHLSGALRQHSPRILGLIDTLAPHSAQRLFATPVPPDAGVGANAIEMLLEIYFNHAVGGRDDDLRAEAAACLLSLVQANPQIGNNITLSLLRHHPERAVIVSQLIDTYLCAGVYEKLNGMFFDIMLELVDIAAAVSFTTIWIKLQRSWKWFHSDGPAANSASLHAMRFSTAWKPTTTGACC